MVELEEGQTEDSEPEEVHGLPVSQAQRVLVHSFTTESSSVMDSSLES